MNNAFSGLPYTHESLGFVANNGTIASLDMFNRQIVATPTTVFQTTPAFTPQYYLQDYLSTGTATVVHDISNTIIKLSVSANGDKAVRQSRQYLLYQPGKLQSVYMTFIPQYSGTFDSSVTIRIGMFDDYRDKNTSGSTYPGTGIEVNQSSMGHFFEVIGSTWYVVERGNSANNVLNVTRIPQANWNLDSLDGNRSTSPSGYDLKNSLFAGTLILIQRQWLGVGAVRMGFIINGRVIYCHMFHQRGPSRGPYTHLSNLPIRWEIEKGANGSANSATLASICGSVQVMGDYTTQGAIYSLPSRAATVGSGGNATRLDTTLRPVVVMRLKRQYCRATFKIKDISFLSDQGGSYTYFKNPIINGASFTYISHPNINSMIEYYYFNNGTSVPSYTLTNGIPFKSGFFTINTSVQSSTNQDELLSEHDFSSNIHGDSDLFVVACCQGTSNSTDVCINATWVEIV